MYWFHRQCHCSILSRSLYHDWLVSHCNHRRYKQGGWYQSSYMSPFLIIWPHLLTFIVHSTCIGRTQAGTSFQAFYPEFQSGVLLPFWKFLHVWHYECSLLLWYIYWTELKFYSCCRISLLCCSLGSKKWQSTACHLRRWSSHSIILYCWSTRGSYNIPQSDP